VRTVPATNDADQDQTAPPKPHRAHTRRGTHQPPPRHRTRARSKTESARHHRGTATHSNARRPSSASVLDA
jgi:hypothetical protein